MAEKTDVRYIRFHDAPKYFGMDKETISALAKASGSVYQLQKIRLIKVRKLEEYMKHFTNVENRKKLIQRKYVRIEEGALIYNIGKHRFIEMARDAGAVYKLGDASGSRILIRLDVFDEYMEQFREPREEMKHPLWKES